MVLRVAMQCFYLIMFPKGETKLAVDVGCGTGMSTRNLFGKFDSVLGVDLSEAMIEEARNCWKDHSSAEFKVAKAEQIPVENNSAQLVLVGRAIHYFDQKTFFQEVDRILVGSYTKGNVIVS